MYKVIPLNYLSFLSHFEDTWIFSTRFRKILGYQISWKSFEVGVKVFHTGTRTHRHDEVSSWRRLKQVKGFFFFYVFRFLCNPRGFRNNQIDELFFPYSTCMPDGHLLRVTIPDSVLTFRHRASCILGQAFHYSPENAFYIFNQQIYFIIWYLLEGASLI